MSRDHLSHHQSHIADCLPHIVVSKVPNGASANETSKLFASEPHIAGSVQDFITAVSFLNILQEEFGITPPDEQPIFDAGSPESRDATLGILNRNEPYAWIDKYYPGAL